VLGRAAAMDVETVVRQVVAEGSELVLISVGYPAAERQSAVTGEALRLAAELRLWLDAVLVGSPQEGVSPVPPDGRVSVLASGAERRRIERAVQPRVRSVRLAPSPNGRPRDRAPVPTATMVAPVAVPAAVAAAPPSDNGGMTDDGGASPLPLASESVE